MEEKVKDPVCGMEIEKNAAKYPVNHKGKTFYFCSKGCVEKFKKEPAKYIKDEAV